MNFLSMVDKARKEAVPLTILLVLTISIYFSIFKGFFQQDEWLAFSYHYFWISQGWLSFLLNIFVPSVGHYQPFNTLVINVLTRIFSLDYLSYALISVGLHTISVFLVYFLAKHLLKDKIISVLTALLFAVMASSYQATAWVLADIGIHSSTLLALLSINTFLVFLENKRNQYFIASVLLLLASLLFKEISIGLFAVLPICFYLFSSSDLIKQKKYSLTIIFIGMVYLVLRVLMIFLPQAYSTDTVVTQSQPLAFLIFNILTFPFIALAQDLIPIKPLLSIAYFIAQFISPEVVGQPNTQMYDEFVQKKILESVSLLIAGLAIAAAVFRFIIDRNSKLTKIIIFSLLFILINAPIFALSPEKVGRVFIFDSRNLYLLSVGGALFISALLSSTFSHSKNVLIAALCILIVVNVYWLQQQISKDVDTGQIRKNILYKISSTYPKLPQKVIFYTESDSSFYGLPEPDKILPFQSGLGQTLLVWYYPSEEFPIEFYQSRFLWEIKDQGYQEIQGRGFGYYREYSELVEGLKEFKLDIDSVYSFKYDSKPKNLEDITEKTRKSLKNDIR